MPGDVLALVVLYRPDPVLVANQRAALDGQIDGVVYVDNGAGAPALSRTHGSSVLRPEDVVIGDGENVGLAAALNRGLDHIRSAGAHYALLLDQDSIPGTDMVSTLARGLALDPSHTVAAGPAIQDDLSGKPEYFARLRLPFNSRIHNAEQAGSEFFDVDFLITSGTLVSLDLLSRAGPMDESLFIDCIDFDWSFRARHRGLRLVATFSTTMLHRRGDDLAKTPFGPLRVHSAHRIYYMHRNRVRLYRRRHVPLAWKVHDVARMVIKLALLSMFVTGRRARLTAALRGIRDGISLT